MIPSSKSLLSKIHEILDNKQKIEQAEQVAKDYVQLSQQINSRIKQFNKLIREGNYYAALDIARLEPPLTTQIERIRFPREREWLQLLRDSGLPAFEGFNDNEFKKVKEICADSSFRQPKGYRDYRKAILLKDKDAAIQSLRKLYEDYPKDLNAKQELIRLETEVFEGIDRRLSLLLKRGKPQAIIEEVKEVMEQTWSIPLQSETWDTSLSLYTEYNKKQHTEQMLQSLSQLKVIQRVGDWRDGGKLVEKLRESKPTEAFQHLDSKQQSEIEAILDWYHKCEIEADKKILLYEKLEQFMKKLDPYPLEQALQPLNNGEIKHHKKNLHHEWLELQSKLPEATEKIIYSYNRAESILQNAITKKTGTLRKFRLLWFLIVPVSASLVFGFYYINNKEGNIAERIVVPFKQENLPVTESAIREWDAFTERFLNNYNPFRNYSAHGKVKDIKLWIDDIHTRHDKISGLLEKINSELEQTPNLSELRRIQLNMSIVKDLFGKLPQIGNSETLDYIDTLSMKIHSIHRRQIAVLKDEIITSLVELESLTNKYFPTRKTNFRNTRSEISETRLLINSLQLKFRLTFDETGISNLKQRFDTDVQMIDQFEKAFSDLTRYTDKLPQSSSLDEYIDNLKKLSALPFQRHAMVMHATRLLKHESKFESLAQQLLLPGSSLAWEQYISIKDATPPLVPKSPDPKEIRIFEDLLSQDSLKSIYRYRLVQYDEKMEINNVRFIHTMGEGDFRKDMFQTSGRIIQTVTQFDETGINREYPFFEKVYLCRTDALSTPTDGEFLELEQLCSESGFYKLLSELCQYDPRSKQIQRSLLQVLDEIKLNSSISPLFKAYLTQELFNIMMVRPYDWGLNFSPAAQIEYRHLLNIKGILSPYDWLRVSAQTRLLKSLTIYYENISVDSYHTQAIVGNDLFSEISRQQVRYGGYVDSDGEYQILTTTPNNRKLFGLLENGSIGKLRTPAKGNKPAEFGRASKCTPLLFFEDATETILDRVTQKSGIDVRAQSYRKFLPVIFL